MQMAQRLSLAKTIWLFTLSDIKTIVLPSAVFGVSNAIALTKSLHPLSRVPLVILWAWLNLIPFAIGNQRSSAAIAEDTINKPWRPLAAGRLNQSAAGELLIASFFCAVFSSIGLGGVRQSLLLVIFDTWYNNFGGGDGNFIIRYFINACGYLCFISGALDVALPGVGVIDDAVMFRWLLLIGAIIWTTTHAQDFSDQKGDRQRGRKTAPIELGDLKARFAICILVPGWTLTSLYFWRPAVFVASVLLSISGVVAFRTVSYRTVREDKRTFRIWNIWIGSIFVLPLLVA